MVQTSKITVSQKDWSDVKLIWSHDMWPGRDNIRPISSLMYLGGNDLSIKTNRPVFWSLILDNKIVGLSSGFKTSLTDYRCRGIWIAPELRGNKLSHMLFDSVEKSARKENSNVIWSYPKKEIISVYTSYGFEITGETDTHYWVSKKI